MDAVRRKFESLGSMRLPYSLLNRLVAYRRVMCRADYAFRLVLSDSSVSPTWTTVDTGLRLPPLGRGERLRCLFGRFRRHCAVFYLCISPRL